MGCCLWGHTESDTTEATQQQQQLQAKMVKNSLAVQKTRVQSLGWEDPLEEGMATHSSILAWRIAMDEGAWRSAESMGLQRGGHD